MVDWTRIETSTAGAGIPDLSGITIEEEKNGLEFWLELKSCPLKSCSVASAYRPAQIAWQKRRTDLGGRVWNLVRHPLSSSLHLFHGRRLIQAIEEGPRFVACLVTKDDDFAGIIDHIKSSG